MKSKLVGATDRTQNAAMSARAAMRRLSAYDRIEAAVAGGEFDGFSGSGICTSHRLRGRADRETLQENENDEKSTDEPQGFVLDAAARIPA